MEVRPRLEGPYQDCQGKLVHAYDDVRLTEVTSLKLSTGEIDSAPAGCVATVLFFVEGSGGEMLADLEIYLPNERFGFANIAVSKVHFHKSAIEKQSGSEHP